MSDNMVVDKQLIIDLINNYINSYNIDLGFYCSDIIISDDGFQMTPVFIYDKIRSVEIDLNKVFI